MKFVTYNLRLDTPHDGINSFFHRAGEILRKIEREKPDVIGFQECLPHMKEFLARHLTDYTVVGCGRGAHYDGEHNPVAFLKDKFELIGLDTEWLSPTPQVPGSRYPEQSDCPRVVTRVTLLPYGTDEPFYVFNTHLDHVSDEARVLGAKRVCSVMRELLEKREMPLVLMGDFNAEPDTPPLRAFLEDEFLHLTDATPGIPCTFHDYGRRNWQQIDYILQRGWRQAGGSVLWTDEDNGLYLSDHYPVAVELTR